MTLTAIPTAPAWTLEDAVLRHGGHPLLTGMSSRCAIEALTHGAAVRVGPDAAGTVASRLHIPLGRIAEVERWTTLYRNRPFWMFPEAGGAADPLPRFEMQYLLVQRTDGLFVLLVPLLSADLRWSLEGRADGLWLVGETGDPHRAAGGGFAGYIACGECPYRLWRTAARDVAACLGVPLRSEKPALPEFVDTLGWCTWDAFYEDVSPEKVVAGLASWQAVGITPRFLILDDGWQDTVVAPTGERRLAGLGTNEKFPGGLAALIRQAKGEFGITTFLVWHALIGAWGGVDGGRLPAYAVRDIGRRFAPGLYRDFPDLDDWWGHLVGVVSPERIAAFYHDYHAGLRAMGVDGIKVDSQAVLEGVSSGLGGRVATATAYRQALESSAQEHFAGRLMNCMAHATETWYLSPQSNLTRTSTDFWPKRPESHGLHLYTNAQVCTWFGQFLHGDWDMFQSDHEMGAYHAAGRALSGSPVYCSDKPGRQDAEVLRRLVCHDGTVLRFPEPGVPGRSCLLHNPTREAVPLTIVNRTEAGAAIGVFHARYAEESALRTPLSAELDQSEVPEWAAEDCILWRHVTGRAERIAAQATFAVTVEHAAYEVLSLVPLSRGRAVIGLRGKFVPFLAVRTQTWSDDAVELTLREGGVALLWCEQSPECVQLDVRSVASDWDSTTRLLSVDIPETFSGTLRVLWRTPADG